MRNLFLIIKNTFKVTFHRKENIIIYLFLPLFGVLISMLIYSSGGSSTLRIGIADQDRSPISQDFVNSLKNAEGYKVSELDEKNIRSAIADRSADAAIIIPKGYGDGIYGNKPLDMEIISIRGQDTTVWIESYINMYTRNLADLSSAAGGDRAAFNGMYGEYRGNPLKFSNLKLPDQRVGKNITVSSLGFLIMFIMLGSSFTSQLILTEKRNRTFYRICTAPVDPRTYIASNTITSLVIVAAQVIIIQLALKFVFRIETFVPDALLFLILMMFGLAAVGLSLMVTAFSESSYMAGTLGTLIMTPTCMVAGCFWPVDFMPDFMQKISYFVPQRWALDAVQRLQEGSGFGNILLNLAILLAFAVTMFVISAYRISRTNSLQKFV